LAQKLVNMYSYNSLKNTYIQLSESLEIYKLCTKIPLSYNEVTEKDSEKDFDHIKQLILMYDKILFFTQPTSSLKHKNCYEFTFGVSHANLFAFKDNEVGILQNRLDEMVLFGGTLATKGVNTNTWIYKFKE